MKRVILCCLLGAVFGTSGCLPGDTRPEPARVFVTAGPSVATLSGVSTDDGWTIQFDRLLAGLGNVSLDGEGCNEYAGAGYDRLFDFAVDRTTKLGEAYGLGACDLQFRLRWPSPEAILEEGVRASDLAMMREVLTTLPMTQPMPGMEGPVVRTTVYAKGVATRAGKSKHFAWLLSGRFTLGECAESPGASSTSALTLAGGNELRPVITFHGEELFHLSPKPGAPLVFDWLANADTNNDGDISMEELAAAPAPMMEMMGGGGPDAGMMDPTAIDLPGLLGFLGNERLPQMAHLDGSRCNVVMQRFGR